MKYKSKICTGACLTHRGISIISINKPMRQMIRVICAANSSRHILYIQMLSKFLSNLVGSFFCKRN